MVLDVTYMSGAGNIFTVIDNRNYLFSEDTLSSLAPLLCNQNKYSNMQTEGLLSLENNDNSEIDFKASFFNPDGSAQAMCGNGGRCAVAFAVAKNFFIPKKNHEIIKFSMSDDVYTATIEGNTIRLKFPPPLLFNKDITIDIEGKMIVGTFADIGARHFVVNSDSLSFQKKINEIDLDELAKPIRYHSDFAPIGVNVNIYSVENRKKIILRTYERGVEAETGACGTGALSTAITAYLKGEIELPVTIVPPSKIPLIVDIEFVEDIITSMTLEGGAEIIGNNSVNL